MRLNQFLKQWVPLLVWMGAIYYLSAQPSDALPDAGAWDLLLKKGAHFTAYGILALLAYRVCGKWKRPFLTAFLFAVLYAISDEYHQTFVPGRNGTIIDVFIDAAGAFTGLMTFFLFKISPKQTKSPTPTSDQP